MDNKLHGITRDDGRANLLRHICCVRERERAVDPSWTLIQVPLKLLTSIRPRIELSGAALGTTVPRRGAACDMWHAGTHRRGRQQARCGGVCAGCSCPRFGISSNNKIIFLCTLIAAHCVSSFVPSLCMFLAHQLDYHIYYFCVCVPVSLGWQLFWPAGLLNCLLPKLKLLKHSRALPPPPSSPLHCTSISIWLFVVLAKCEKGS